MFDRKTIYCTENSRSQSNKNLISLFPKKWCFKKNISNFVVKWGSMNLEIQEFCWFVMYQTMQIFNFWYRAELWLIITIWQILSAESSCCHKMEFFRNSIRYASYSVPNFIEWFIMKDLDIMWNIAAHI